MGHSEAASISAAQGLRKLLPLAIKHLLGSHHGSSLRGKFWGTSTSLSHPHAHLSASPVCPPHTSCHYSWSCVTSNEAAPHRSASPAAHQPSASPHTALREKAPGAGSVCSQQGSPQGWADPNPAGWGSPVGWDPLGLGLPCSHGCLVGLGAAARPAQAGWPRGGRLSSHPAAASAKVLGGRSGRSKRSLKVSLP